MATANRWDYSVEDAKDDTGIADHDILGDDGEVWKYIDSIPKRRVWVTVGLLYRSSSLLIPVHTIDDLLMLLHNIRCIHTAR
jgi:hypothetical protein